VNDSHRGLTELNAGNSSRASHVWRLETAQGPEIVRRAWWTNPEVSAFMLGLSGLFGVDPRDLQATAGAYRHWQGLGAWAVPAPLGLTEVLGSAALRVEFIQGDRAQDLQTADGAELGRQMACIHTHRSSVYGDVNAQTARPLSDFYPRALGVVQEVAQRYQPANWAAHWPQVQAAFAAAPEPTHTVPMLLDWSGDQFVWRGGQPYALVDVEAGALAPPELDLCLWELLLTGEQARAFRAAYAARLPFPDLRPHRPACRLLLLALEVEGSPPLPDWLRLPHTFETQTFETLEDRHV
jgi:hypothetical protein